MRDALRVVIHLGRKVRAPYFIKTAQGDHPVSHVALVRTAEDLRTIIPFLREAFDCQTTEPFIADCRGGIESACPFERRISGSITNVLRRLTNGFSPGMKGAFKKHAAKRRRARMKVVGSNGLRPGSSYVVAKKD